MVQRPKTKEEANNSILINSDGNIITPEVWKLNIHEKLMRIQAGLKAPKDLFNNFGNYKYRSAESILEAVKPLLMTYGAAVTLSDCVCEVSGRVYVKSIATLTDCVTGQSVAVSAYAREEQSKKGCDEAMITGACSSYARKYALGGLFLCDDSKDVDSNEYQAPIIKAETQAKPAPKKQAQTEEPDNAPVEIVDSRTELRNFIKANKLDGHMIADVCGLNQTSTEEDYAAALVYAKGLVR